MTERQITSLEELRTELDTVRRRVDEGIDIIRSDIARRGEPLAQVDAYWRGYRTGLVSGLDQIASRITGEDINIIARRYERADKGRR